MKLKNILVLILILMLFASCTPKQEEHSVVKDINIGVQHGDGYTVVEDIQNIKSGSDVIFTVKANEGYQILGFSYSEFEKLDNDRYLFKNVLYPTIIEVYYTVKEEPTATPTQQPTVSVTPEPTPTLESTVTEELTLQPTPSIKPETTQPSLPNISINIEDVKQDAQYINKIIYCFNGGEYVNSPGVQMMIVEPDTSHHQRINTYNDIKRLKRSGYTLIGWNTESDGSGTHTSIGSRCTLNESGATVLYASWSKWSNAENFTYVKSGSNAYITAYSGDEDIVSVPATIDGYNVTRIYAGAFNGVDCSKVILPSSIVKVDNGAFNNCTFTTLHFFDTIKTLNDASFTDCSNFSTIYICQTKTPVYIVGNGKVEAYDSLILSKKKSIIFFAGSSVLYGIDAYRATEAFKDTEYDVINLGWTAPRNALFQVEIITALLQDGDVLIHAPEYVSSCHLMKNINMGASAWQILDCNLDLFSYVDIRTLPNALTSFASFNTTKSNSTKVYTYDDYCKSMDFLGYKCSNRPVIHKTNWAPEGSCQIVASLITDVSISRLRNLYTQMQNKGATVYLSYPPIDENYLAANSKDATVRQGYVDRLSSIGPTVLGTPEMFFYDGSYFHDTEYHLVTKGAQEHTDKMVELVKNQMILDGLLSQI